MGYFEEVVCPLAVGGLDEEGWVVRYTLRSVEEREFGELLRAGCALGEVEVEVVERFDTAPRSLGMPGGAAVVAANKYIGFGQSATQEEVHVGSSPEACPAVLFTPPLSDDQVVIIRGAQAMVNVTGQRRDIKAEEMPVPDGGLVAWRERTMLFMDALEMDMVEPGDSLPDLMPANLRRELKKSYTAFSASGIREVRTGLWGCGAFCGDPDIKMLLLWLAASLAGTKLVVVCDGEGRDFALKFRCLVNKALAVVRDTTDLWELLNQAPASLVRGNTLPWIIEQLEKRQR
jgi:poly(ADP-ribose) glycohydrolase